ncbi:MAG: mannose-1-phosphate guanylyltransferase/mannose-6-phosphate isomerase [Candidatus Aquirickettsiella gammari]
MLIPVILSGGTGSRLWPLSREAHPKPFIRLNNSSLSLIQKTYERAVNIPKITQIITVTNTEYYHQSKKELARLNYLANFSQIKFNFLLESSSRNTAPAIVLSALLTQQLVNPDTVLLILPADHVILNQKKFNTCVKAAYKLAQKGFITTFGVIPNKAETGYGYIKYTVDATINSGYLAASFHEKPSLEESQLFIEQGNYLWNSGIFCFTAKVLIQQFKKYAPGLYAQILNCWKQTAKNYPFFQGNDRLDLDAKNFNKIEKISIDYALMEKIENLAIIPANFGWSDMGSWDEFSKQLKANQQGNRILGEAILEESYDTTVYNQYGSGRLITGLGLKNLTIVDTQDALLIAENSYIQQVKQLVEKLKDKGCESYRFHQTVYRPWGNFTVLEQSHRYKLKRIVVHPGASLSLQSHQHRSEYWVIVKGIASVQNGEKKFTLQVQESTLIPIKTKHCICNPGENDLIFIEIQSGDYLGEDDIIRFKDDYGRETVVYEDANVPS